MSKSGTRILALLVPFVFRKFVQRVRQTITNFGKRASVRKIVPTEWTRKFRHFLLDLDARIELDTVLIGERRTRTL